MLRTCIPSLVLFAVLLFFTNYMRFLVKKPVVEVSREEMSYTFNRDFLKVFSLGQQRMMAAYLWIYTLLRSDIQHYKGSGDSWMFLRFMAIARLDPQFYLNYKFGGLYLSVVKDDVRGSVELLKEGLASYPGDFWLNYYLAFNYFYELKDHESALVHFEKIKGHPLVKKRFRHLPSLVAKLYAKRGDLESAYWLLLNSYQETQNLVLKRHFEKILYSLRAKIDLSCLNEASQRTCRSRDFFGRPYLRDSGGLYRAEGKVHSLKLNLR